MALRGNGKKERWVDEEALPSPAAGRRYTLRNSFRQRKLSRAVLALTLSAGISLLLLWVYPSFIWNKQVMPTVRVIDVRATPTLADDASSAPVNDTAPSENATATVPQVRKREESNRYDQGTKATLIVNARIWDGETEKGILGDILLDKGLIKAVGEIDAELLREIPHDVVEANAHWVTPGIVDLFWRSAVGQDVSGELPLIAPPQEMPFNFGFEHWTGIEKSTYAGTTSALVFPAYDIERSSHNIAGNFVKLRAAPLALTMPALPAMSIEPPVIDKGGYPHPTATWSFWKYLAGYVRGRPWKLPYDTMPGPPHQQSREGCRLFAECHTVAELREIVRSSAVHHLQIDLVDYMGSEYWGSDLLRQAWGKPPAVAITKVFEDVSGEMNVTDLAAQAFSEGVHVLVKPAVASRIKRSRRNVMDEARSVFAYGLANITEALASVTSVPAEIAGYGDRLGHIREGYDADLVLWSMHPLRFEEPSVARPVQVWVDGIAQIPGKVPFLEAERKLLLPPHPLS